MKIENEETFKKKISLVSTMKGVFDESLFKTR